MFARFHVTDEVDFPIVGASCWIGDDGPETTGYDGIAIVPFVHGGSYKWDVTCMGYSPESNWITTTGDITEIYVSMKPVKASVLAIIKDDSGSTLGGATFNIAGETATSSSSGEALIRFIDGDMSMAWSASKSGYVDASGWAEIYNGKTNIVYVTMIPIGPDIPSDVVQKDKGDYTFVKLTIRNLGNVNTGILRIGYSVRPKGTVNWVNEESGYYTLPGCLFVGGEVDASSNAVRIPDSANTGYAEIWVTVKDHATEKLLDEYKSSELLYIL